VSQQHTRALFCQENLTPIQVDAVYLSAAWGCLKVNGNGPLTHTKF
jgi:hypothetical protein